MQVRGWAMRGASEALQRFTYDIGTLEADDVLIRVEGCGLCHTDLGYVFDSVPIRGQLPRILGHEIAGVVDEAGPRALQWSGKAVVVPAVIPCGHCDPCTRGRSGICPEQVFVGNDIHGGFASHVRVPARGLCEIPAHAIDIAQLAVVADAVTTPYHAVERSELAEGGVAIIVGAGGIGAFATQIAKAKGASVVALDINSDRLELVSNHGADYTHNVRDASPGAIKKVLRGIAKERGWRTSEWHIFETSGTTAGQELAFGLLNYGATLMVVGYTPNRAPLRLSNLMAFDARALGVWGCPPALYDDALKMVVSGVVAVEPFIEERPMSQINDVLDNIHRGKIHKRVVFRPDF